MYKRMNLFQVANHVEDGDDNFFIVAQTFMDTWASRYWFKNQSTLSKNNTETTILGASVDLHTIFRDRLICTSPPN